MAVHTVVRAVAMTLAMALARALAMQVATKATVVTLVLAHASWDVQIAVIVLIAYNYSF